MSFLSNYAHLLGIKPKGARAEDEDDEKAKKAKGRRAEDDDENDPDAEEDDNDPDAEDDDENDPDAEEEDDEEKPSGRKAKGKKAEDGDDDEADAKVAKGRAIERKRIASIFGCKAAGIRPDMAASLAFNTSLSASQAMAQLKQAAAFGAPQGGRMSLDDRMRGAQKHHVGQDAKKPAATGSEGKIARMTELYNKANGAK
jgi:hypothetical protein